MSGDDARGSGPRAIDEAVRALLAEGVNAPGIAERLATVDSVSEARVRTGLVKTEPPLVEVEVDYVAEPGELTTRVYDLAERPDGSLEWGAAHD